MKRTLAQRVSSLERRLTRLQRDLVGVEREMLDRTRAANRIGFEVFREQDWDIGDVGRTGRKGGPK